MDQYTMPDKFTVCGDPEAEKILRETVTELRRDLAFSAPVCSIFLGGSYGRGEGGVQNTAAGSQLYNDLDIFVFAPEWRLIQARRMQSQLAAIGRQWSKKLQIDVDFSPVKGYGELLRHGRRLIYQELKHGAVPLAGDPEFLRAIPDCDRTELPWQEAGRLLLNRGMGLLMAGQKLNQPQRDEDFIRRNFSKLILGCADARLIARKNYFWHLPERQKALSELLSAPDYELYLQAVQYKTHPTPHWPEPPQEFFWRLRELFLRAVQDLAGGIEVETRLLERARAERAWGWQHYLNYARKTGEWHRRATSFMPPVLQILLELYNIIRQLESEQPLADEHLFRNWRIFN